MGFDPNKRAEVFVTVDALADHERAGRMNMSVLPVEAPTGDFAEEAISAISQPRDGLNCMLLLLLEPMFMSGSWADVLGGWQNPTGLVLTFAAADRLVTLRCRDLKLDESKVRAFPKKRGVPHDYREPFETQMENFL